MKLSRGLPVLLLVLLLGAPSLARAGEPERIRLRYERAAAASQCPDEERLRGLVAARIGRDPFGPEGTRSVDVRIEPNDHGLRGRLELFDADGKSLGKRKIEDSHQDCGELAAQLTLAIAIALDVLARSPSAQPAGFTPAEPPRPDSSSSPMPAPAPPERDRAESLAPAGGDRVHPRVGAGGLVSFGTAPAPTVGLAVLGGLAWRFWSLDVEGRLDSAASTSRDPVAQGNARSQLLLFSLAPCAHTKILYGCALASVGRLRGDGQDVTQPRQASYVYAAFGARAGLEYELVHALKAQAIVDLTLSPTPAILHVNGATAWETPVLAGAGRLGLLATF